MKIFSILILIAATTVFPQQNKSNPTLELEQEIKNSPIQNDLNILAYTNAVSTKKKSTGSAILYSLLLPGMGELYADGYNSGRYFTIVEGILWGAYIGMTVYANSKENDYKAFATTFASVNKEGKDETYFATIGEYDNIEYYNDQKALEKPQFGTELLEVCRVLKRSQNVGEFKVAPTKWVKEYDLSKRPYYYVGITLGA